MVKGIYVARGFIPVGVRSAPLCPVSHTASSGFTAAAQPNGVVRHSDKSPHHREFGSHRRGVTLQPADIPEWVIADFVYEPCSQGICNDVSSERQEFFSIADCPVVIAGLPQRATSACRFVHCLGASGFGSTNDIP